MRRRAVTTPLPPPEADHQQEDKQRPRQAEDDHSGVIRDGVGGGDTPGVSKTSSADARPFGSTGSIVRREGVTAIQPPPAPPVPPLPPMPSNPFPSRRDEEEIGKSCDWSDEKMEWNGVTYACNSLPPFDSTCPAAAAFPVPSECENMPDVGYNPTHCLWLAMASALAYRSPEQIRHVVLRIWRT